MKEPLHSHQADRRRSSPAAPAGARRLAPPVTVPSGAPGRCACGGGCPRCAQHRIRVSARGDPFERDADRLAGLLVNDARHAAEPGERVDSRHALDALRLAADRRLGAPAARASLHTGPAADRLAGSLGARAFTFGDGIGFAEGEFRPDTEGGRRLIAHELVHVAQQPHLPAPVIHRQPADVVNMEPLVVRSTLQPTEQAVPNLARLTGEGVDPTGITLARDEQTIRRNAPSRTRRLPFNAGSWDAQAILTALGQYDTMPETDSDAIRCVQAVAMASRVVDGPDAVTGFLRAMILEGMTSRPQHPRQRTAIDVLEHVIGRIEMQRATFGDLLWAQEALHDLFYNDVSGTPETDILARMGPPLELFGRGLVRMNVWCNGPQDVVNAANRLQPGEQLLVNTWQIVFNTAFDQLEEQGIQVGVGRTTVVEVNGRRVRIRRIDASTRPAHTAIDVLRDLKTGHQLLVMKDSTTSRLRLYEPEITDTGRHLEDLAADGSNLTRYFRDLPDVGIYNYIQILGKLTPATMPSTRFGSATSP
jgi:hypothetical protein